MKLILKISLILLVFFCSLSPSFSYFLCSIDQGTKEHTCNALAFLCEVELIVLKDKNIIDSIKILKVQDAEINNQICYSFNYLFHNSKIIKANECTQLKKDPQLSITLKNIFPIIEEKLLDKKQIKIEIRRLSATFL